VEEKKVPALRFRGFDNAWEQCKVNSLFEPLTERNDDLLPYSKTLSVATMTYKEVGNGAADSSLANYKRLRLGDVAFEGHTSKEFRYGRFVLNDAGDGIMSPRFSALRPISELPVQFWKYYIHYEPIMKRSLVNCTKAGTMMNELVVPEFLQESLLVPSTDEQVQIGKYFANLNHLIILHQRKLEMLKKVKKSMLEKMFPKNDAKVPEVRFSDFTDAWEQRRLGELGHTEGGTSIESEFDSEGKYKVISIGSYSEESDYVDQGIRAIESEKTLRRVLQKNDLTMILNDKTSSGKIIGRVLFIDRSDVFVYNQRTEMIRGYEDRYYPKFLYHLLNAPIQRKKIVKQSQGNTQIYVNWSKVSETQYMIPEVGEQTIISNYFSYFDHLISLHQRKLEKLKNIKKSMLEKMFI
jgi:type I restriction-modification system specificity subunit